MKGYNLILSGTPRRQRHYVLERRGRGGWVAVDAVYACGLAEAVLTFAGIRGPGWFRRRAWRVWVSRRPG